MPTLTIEYSTETERLKYERLIASVQEMIRLGGFAAPGTVLDTGERFALDHQLLLTNLQAAPPEPHRRRTRLLLQMPQDAQGHHGPRTGYPEPPVLVAHHRGRDLPRRRRS